MGFEPVVVLGSGERFGEGAEGLFDVWKREAGRFAGSAGGEEEGNGENRVEARPHVPIIFESRCGPYG